MGKVSGAAATLRSKEGNCTCSDLKAILKDLGFDVQRAGSGNHHVVDHDGIPGFTGANFDCGHDKLMKPCYPRNMRKLLEKYETENTQYLEGQAK